MINSLATERLALLGVIDPDAYSQDTYSTGWVDMSRWGRIAALVSVGDLGSSATVNAKLEQAATDGGNPSDITGKVITELTQAGSDSNKQVWINLRADEMTEGQRFVRLSVTIGTAASDAAGYIFGVDPRYAPADDAATVDEVVN